MHAAADGPRRSRSGRSAVLIVRAAEVSATELTDFFVDRVGAELASDPDDAERLVRAAIGRAQPYRLVLIAATPMFVGLATRMKAVPGTEGMKILLLAHQPASSGEREVAVDAVVPDSVGLAQLVQMVRQLAGISLPDPDEPPSGAVERVGTVLLVEDDLVSQRLTSSMLTELGIDCQIVGNGRAAVAAAQQQDFDAVLMDCMMPGLDGYAATRLLRTLPGKVSQLPVIAMSASDGEEDHRRCQDAGMDGYLPKPFDIGQLAEQLRNWMPAVARPDVRLPDQSDRSEAAAVPAAGDAGATDDPIDGVALAKLADRLPADRMARLVGTFLGETPKLLQRMTTAAAADDFAELQLAAHSLKGSSAFLGAAQLSGSAKAVEQAAVAELAATELISETTAAFEQARLALLDRYPTAASV